ncbi:MAG TPA: ATP-binding protein, partial [Longimicrobiales bacterium]|nr:ATP-binding protein [Longimicrobiales bacterium]
MTDRRDSDPFAGSGAVSARAREMEWSTTPLGPVDQWPADLRTMVRTIMESPFPSALWCGPELTLIYNDAYTPVLGAKHPRALGRSGRDVWSEIWPHIAPLFESIRRGEGPVFQEDAPFFVERAGSEPSEPGEPNAWFTFSLSPVRDQEGAVVAFLNMVQESTARLRAEREAREVRDRAERMQTQFREVFTHAPSFMAVLRGPEHVFEYANEAYYRLVGHRELIGLPVLEALPEVREQGFRDLLDQVVRTGEPLVGRETRIVLSPEPGTEPEERFVDFVYYPLRDEANGPVGVVAHGYDVTEHVRSRKDAQRARREAEDASQAKSQFLANMSHEIRTPINAIMGYADLLELGTAGPLTDQQRSQLERLRASSHHLLSLVNDILDVAKVEAGRMDVDASPAEVARAVASALSVVRPQASDRGIQLENGCTPEADVRYNGDEDRVRQILVNLISNAVKFTEAGGKVRVECGTTEDRPPGLEARREGLLTFIRVTDTGIGIAPEDLPQVFKPFVQVDRGHTRTYGGTGLGLTISRHLARLMGGDLTARSTPGEGSTFTVWLPTEPAPAGDPLLEEARDAIPPHLTVVGATLRDGTMEVLDRFVSRLRQDPRVPGARKVADADLQDHAASFLADIAQSLIVLEDSEAIPDRLLQDGSEIQRIIAELHGRQRARLGWSDDALTREWGILLEEMEKAVRRGTRDLRIDEALDLMRRFTDRARRISLRSFHHME